MMDVRTREQPSSASEHLDDPVNIKRQLVFIWRNRLLIAACTLLVTAIAIVVGLLTPKRYEATTLLEPVTNRADSGRAGALGSLASELGGVAALAGLSMSADTAKAEALAVLQSEALTERYIAQNNLLPILYANKWDVGRKAWKVDNPDKAPTVWKANRFFDKNIRKITTSPKTGLITMTITWTDPALAARWANEMVKMTNDQLRTKTIDESERNIHYLEDQVAKTNEVEVRRAIYSLMQTEINKGMLARGSLEYALKVLDPAVQPELASSPRKTLWAALGFGGGLFLGIFLAFMRAAWRESD
jgi:uncharacterized protein involved in exopolysaccharide biosynthesis